jgi:plasmid stabilization system protein ParE
MTFRVNITARARRDVERVVNAVRTKAPINAARWHARIRTSFRKLTYLPTRFGLCDEADDLGLEIREYVFGKRQGAFRVVYIIDGQTVHILRVVHASHGPLTLADLS